MSRMSIVSFAAALVIGRLGWAGEESAKEGKCCATAASEKVAQLLASWKAATEDAKTMCADERTKLEAQFIGIVKECPIGSRMGGTLGFVKETLFTALKADAACNGCPAGKGDGKAAAAEPTCEGGKLMAARSKLLTSLNELASHAACATSTACAKSGAATASAKSSFCEKKAAEIIAMVRKEECDKGAAAILMKEIDGLKCETKAGEILAAIRAEHCDDGAAKIVVKAANEIFASVTVISTVPAPTAPAAAPAACAKSGATTASAKSSFCEKKAAEIIAMVRKEECDKGAAAILMKEIDGLKCETKAGEIVAAIRAEHCDDGAAKIVVKAANEILASAGSLARAVATTGSTKSSACCADGGACCKDAGAKATALKASWEKAPAEFASLCPQKKKELMASMRALSAKSKTVALMPETVLALADGLDALDGLNAKLADFAKANPEALKEVPEEVKKSVETQNALIHDASEVLHRVKATLQTCAGDCAKKTETAAN